LDESQIGGRTMSSQARFLRDSPNTTQRSILIPEQVQCTKYTDLRKDGPLGWRGDHVTLC